MMDGEKTNTPPPAPVNQDITAGKPVPPQNQTATRSGGGGRPTPPPNTDTTKGGGK